MDDLQYRLKKALFRGKLGVAEHREYAILNTALTLMLKKGFEAFTFQDLAKKCKVSRPLVHHYFPNKQRLAERLLDMCTVHLVDHIEQRLLAVAQNPRKHLEVYCRANLELCKDKPAVVMGFCYFFYLCNFQPKVRQRNTDLSALGRERIRLFLTQLGVTREIPEKAIAIQIFLTGAMIRLATESFDDNEQEIVSEATVQECLRLAAV